MITLDLQKIIKREAAARTYAKTNALRRESIDLWSQWIFDALREEAIDLIIEHSFLGEIRRRMSVRRALRHWTSWAQHSRKAREDELRMREETFDRLRTMGLGDSVYIADRVTSDIPFDLANADPRMDDFEADVALHQVSLPEEKVLVIYTSGHRLSGPRPTSFLHRLSSLP